MFISHRPQVVAVSAATLVSVVMAVGCGGSSEDGTSSSSTGSAAPAPAAEAPTKAEYIASADKICELGEKETTKIFEDQASLAEELSKPETTASPDQAAQVAAKLADALDRQADLKDATTKKLAALEPPDSGAADAYLKAREQVAEAARSKADAIAAYGKRLDQPTADAIGPADEAVQKASSEDIELAKKFGFESCGGQLVR